MKNKVIYVCIVIIILSFLIAYKLIAKNTVNNINKSLVYIESINESTIKSGSGFVYKIDGNKDYIVTNYHVIEGYDNIYVYNIDKDKLEAEVLGYDEYNDISIIIIDNKLNLKKADIGNSDIIKKDESIFVVGNPSNIDNIGTITKGKVLNTSKNLDMDFSFNAIEVAAKTNFGNSGGPLLNKKGQVIGMMFLKDNSVDNISFAIPISFVVDTITKLENRPNIGAVMASTTNLKLLRKYELDQIDTSGVVVLEIIKGGLLEKYGLKKGDVITSFNGIDIVNIKEFKDELYRYNKGDIIELNYYRDNKYYEVIIEL